MDRRSRLLDLNALQTLVAVVDAGNMTVAARELSYSPSTVSMQLKKLEDSLGVVLLTRTRDGVRPTRPGQIAVRDAREILRLNQALTDRLTGNEIDGVVRLGLPADLAPVMRATWRRFAELFPRVEMQVASELSVELGSRLDSAALDLAIVTLPAGSQRGHLLRREPLCWVGNAGSSAIQAERLPLAIGSDGDCIFRTATLAALDRASRRYRIAYESRTFAALSAQISIGLAISTAIPSMIEPDMDILSPVEHGLPDLPAMELRLCRETQAKAPAVERLAELIVADMSAIPTASR